MQDALFLLQAFVEKGRTKAHQLRVNGVHTVKETVGRIARLEKGAGILAANGVKLAAEQDDAAKGVLHAYDVSSFGDEEGRSYSTTSLTCNCQDFHRAPKNLCKHRFAVLLHEQINEVLAPEMRASAELGLKAGQSLQGLKKELDDTKESLAGQIQHTNDVVEQLNKLRGELHVAKCFEAKVNAALGAFVRTLAE